MSRPGRRLAGVMLLHAAALAVLVAALMGVPALDPAQRPRWVLLVDRSQSMPRSETDAAAAEMLAALGPAKVLRIDFAGTAGAAGATTDAALDPTRTDIEAALHAALAALGDGPLAGVAVLSDGHQTQGDASRPLRALQAAGVPVRWRALGRAAPPVQLGEVLAPTQARGGIALSVALAGGVERPLRLRGRARGEGGAVQEALATPQDGRATLAFDAFRGGAVVVDLVLEDATSGAPLDRRADAAVVQVEAPARLLVAQGSPGILARSLAAGGWPLRVVPAAQLDAEAGALAGVDAVVLDDVAATDATPRFWQALDRAVRERGVGLVVLGGERAYARGGYRGSALEALLPLQAEPAADDERAAVVFAVDKSGSMGQGSGGVDRFAMAQRAVLDTARSLGERDAVGLIAFDVEPRVLLPLAPLAEGRAALERDWPVKPAGGTRLAPALELAIAQLEQAPAARRLLVLVTDGFTEAAALPALRARLARARIEAVALAVGPDADLPALQRLFGTEPGAVLRVAEAAELPQVMKSGLERRRARVERGDIAVKALAPMPFAPGRVEAWPPVAAYAATRPASGASVLLQAERGDALMATWTQGRGRVAALATGLGAWTPRWATWSAWPQWAGGLADWASGGTAGTWRFALAGSDAVEIDGELTAGTTVAIDTPRSTGQPAAALPVAPGRWRVPLPEAGPGLYTVRLNTPLGTRRASLLRQAPEEAAQSGIAPALAAWQAAGWLQPWDGQRLPRPPAAPEAPPDRSLLALALLLALAGVALDRAAAFSPLLRRWRARP